MPKETPNHKLRYPEKGDSNTLTAYWQQLAEDTERELDAIKLSQLVVPGSSDGKLVIVKDGAAAYTAMKGDATIDEEGNLQLGSKVVGTNELGDKAVTTAKLDDNSVGSAAIGENAVGSSEIAANAVGASELAASAVEAAKIKDGAVTEAKVGDGAVTSRKLKPTIQRIASEADSTIFTKWAAATGLVYEITPVVASVIKLSGIIRSQIVHEDTSQVEMRWTLKVGEEVREAEYIAHGHKANTGGGTVSQTTTGIWLVNAPAGVKQTLQVVGWKASGALTAKALAGSALVAEVFAA